MENLPTLQELVSEASRVFVANYISVSVPHLAACAPGRVNIIGEHVDYNDGFVLPMALPMWTVVVGSRRSDTKCRVHTEVDSFEIRDYEFDCATELHPLEPTSLLWMNYILGVVSLFPLPIKSGFDCVVVSSVPLGGGLSSSASLEAAMFTFLECLTEPEIPVLPVDKALVCQKAEHEFAGVPCGIMDQFAAVLAQSGKLMLLDCRSQETAAVAFPHPQHVFLIANSCIKHQLGDGAYRQRRDACERVSKILGVASLRDVTTATLHAKSSQFTPDDLNKALHVVEEISRTQSAIASINEGALSKLGELMKASHASLRYLYEVSCKEIDLLVATANDTQGVLGSRITGGGFGGCCVTLVEKSQVEQLVAGMRDAYKKKFNMTPKFYMATPQGGASDCSQLL